MKTEKKIQDSKNRLHRSKTVGTVLSYVAMVAIFTLLKPPYLSTGNIRSILVQTAMLGIIASGMTLVMMTGGVDMSVGAVAGAATLAGMWVVVFDKQPLAVGILIALAVALVIGLINGVCISYLGIAPFVASLGTMFLAQGLQYLFSDGGMAISYGFPASYKFLGSGALGPIPMPVVIFMVIFVVLLVVTEYTPAGRYFRSTGLNQFTSQLSGVRIRLYTLLSYVLCSVFAMILGMVLGASQSYISPDHGGSFMMDSLLAVLLGKVLTNSVVSIPATAYGALFLRSFEAGLTMVGLPVTVVNVCKGTLLVLILLLALLRQKKKGGK